MRSNCDFIEVTGLTNGKKTLINKRSIIFVTPGESDDHATIMMQNGDRMAKILTKESYKDVTEEILWNGWYRNAPFDLWQCSGALPEESRSEDGY